jgi:hypothetical protein
MRIALSLVLLLVASAAPIDVYDAGVSVIDPTTVADASTLRYFSGVLPVDEGHTIFFRGTNGYYGAWVIDEFTTGSFAGEPTAWRAREVSA